MIGIVPDSNQKGSCLPPFIFQEKSGYINWEAISNSDIETLNKYADLNQIQVKIAIKKSWK